MVLKILDYRMSETEKCGIEEWIYLDNIECATSTYDETVKMATVTCKFKDGNKVTFSITNVAYLMSDNGKTIEKIRGVNVEELGNPDEVVYTTLQEAAEVAMNNKSV